MFGKNPDRQQPFLADRGLDRVAPWDDMVTLAERVGGGATFELSTKGASNS
jgi:hypothetical protein